MTAAPPSLTCESPQDAPCLYVAYPGGVILAPSDGDGAVSTDCKAGQACTHIAASQRGSRNCRPSRQRLSTAERCLVVASHLYRFSQQTASNSGLYLIEMPHRLSGCQLLLLPRPTCLMEAMPLECCPARPSLGVPHLQ